MASNGYVIVRVGTDHHLADVRGYAYEHRLVAEQKLGRRLLPGEIAHHIDENKENNAPENIEVLASRSAHMTEHRSQDSNLQLPDEKNTEKECECGCGSVFMKYDSGRRPRRFVSGHNLAVRHG